MSSVLMPAEVEPEAAEVNENGPRVGYRMAKWEEHENMGTQVRQ